MTNIEQDVKLLKVYMDGNEIYPNNTFKNNKGIYTVVKLPELKMIIKDRQNREEYEE